jgi:SAM-dependent methyltransferase
MSKENARQTMREIMQTYLHKGDTTGWFEAVYAAAEGDNNKISWADMHPNPNLTEWLDRNQTDGTGKTALKIGCGLGDDAEALAQRGFAVTAFDISPTAIAWCLKRFPDTRVNYVAGDLLTPSSSWFGGFDLVLEVYTLQVLTADLRPQAIENTARFIKPGGTLLVICRGRNESDDPGKMPYPLTKQELAHFQSLGLSEIRFEDYVDDDTRRFRVEYRVPNFAGE